MNPPIGRVLTSHRESPDFSCGSQFWIIGRVLTDSGPGSIKRPSFLNQNPLLDTASLRLVRDFVGYLRHDLRVHLAGAWTSLASPLPFRLAVDETVLLGGEIGLFQHAR